MKVFGFKISKDTAPAEQKSSPSALWLRGDDIDTSQSTLNNAYQQVVWVYRAINAIAEQIANIPFVFSAGERGRETLITKGPLLDFYDRPHPQINRFQYWELRVIWLMLRGECVRVPIYDGRKLSRIVMLDPAHFHHIVEAGQLIGWRFSGFGPQAPFESQVFLPEEVWFEKLPNPFDFWRGMPPLYVASNAAKTDFAASSFMKGLLENNADLGVVVRTENQLDEAQQEQVLAALRQRKRRAGTADRPLLLWNGVEVTKPQLSSADLQFLENRKFSRAEICAAFGVPEEIVTITDNAKYDVMAGSRLNFIENRVAPLCARLEAAENSTTVRALCAALPSSLSSRASVKIENPIVGWFDLDSLPIMQEARRTRLDSAKAGFDMGI